MISLIDLCNAGGEVDGALRRAMAKPLRGAHMLMEKQENKAGALRWFSHGATERTIHPPWQCAAATAVCFLATKFISPRLRASA